MIRAGAVAAALNTGFLSLALLFHLLLLLLAFWLGATPPRPSRHPQLRLPCQPAPLHLQLLQATVVTRALQEFFARIQGA